MKIFNDAGSEQKPSEPDDKVQLKTTVLDFAVAFKFGKEQKFIRILDDEQITSPYYHPIDIVMKAGKETCVSKINMECPYCEKSNL